MTEKKALKLTSVFLKVRIEACGLNIYNAGEKIAVNL